MSGAGRVVMLSMALHCPFSASMAACAWRGGVTVMARRKGAAVVTRLEAEGLLVSIWAGSVGSNMLGVILYWLLSTEPECAA
jgi:hypothetical protein